MKYYWMILLLLLSVLGCGQTGGRMQPDNRQDINVGGPCEGCEAIHESTVPFSGLPAAIILHHAVSSDSSITISGQVFDTSGQPAAGIILYVYQTNTSGIYPKTGAEKGWAKRHGFIRGWIRTNDQGFYSFKTVRPGSYPGSDIPAHIHITIKEPGKIAYYLEDFLFADDPMLTEKEKSKLQQRGGNGILEAQQGKPDVFIRNIYLGKNIPGYTGT